MYIYWISGPQTAAGVPPYRVDITSRGTRQLAQQSVTQFLAYIQQQKVNLAYCSLTAFGGA